MGTQMRDDWTDDDASLVVRAQEDRAVFAELYRRYLPRVHAYCLSRLRTREQAEDATSQIFLRALAALPTHRPDLSFRAWLFTIAHHIVIDCYRARTELPFGAIGIDRIDALPLPEDTVVARDQTARLLAVLSEDQRHIMELRLAGLTGVEIATVLGRSLSAVKMAQLRALERMREASRPEDRAVSVNQEPADEQS